MERMLEPAQQIKRWTGQPTHLAALSAIRRIPDGSTIDHCRIGAETLPGVRRRCTYTPVVGPWCEGYWKRSVPDRHSHASRYSACLPQSFSPLSPRQDVQLGMALTRQTSERAAVATPTPAALSASGCDARWVVAARKSCEQTCQ